MNMDAIALSNLDGVGALPGLNLQFVIGITGDSILGKFAGGGVFNRIPVLWWHIRTVATTNYYGGFAGCGGGVKHHRAKLAEF